MLLQGPLGRYGPYGPPFSDPELQATYLAEVKDLASSALITESVAKQLVASVMNSALAAGKSAIPEITAEVKRVAAKAATTAAHKGAALGVGEVLGYSALFAGLTTSILWALSRVVSSKSRS